MVNRRHRLGGFTLVEALVGSVILTVSLVGMYSGWIFIATNSEGARRAAVAGELARGEIERFKVFGTPIGATLYPIGTCTTNTSGVTTWTAWTGSYDPSDSNISTDKGWHTSNISYFDSSGARVASSSGATFSMSDTVTDANADANCSGTPPYSFTSSSERAVVVTVSQVSTGATILSVSTNIVPGGF